jgi:hypothetical protein
MRKLLASLILTVTCGASIADASDIREDMVVLDRALIPVAVLVSEGRADLAWKAMRLAGDRWISFKNKHYASNTKDAGWRKDFDLIDALIWEAHTIIRGGNQLVLSKEPLERVNRIMTNLRRRNEMDHYFDRVLAFREPLNAMVAATQSKAPPEDAVSLIRTSYAAAMPAWERMLAADPGTAYRLTVNELNAFRAKLALETAALEALGKALAANDPSGIIATAAATRPPFVGIYNSFGDFHGLIWEGS